MATYTYASISQALPRILSDITTTGTILESRNGQVAEFLNTQITLTDPVYREVTCSNRKANVFAQIAETMWVLSGKNDVDWLGAYLPRAHDYSDDGITWRAGYGPRLRNHHGVDQLRRVVDQLNLDPFTRQAVIQIWDVTDGQLEPVLDRACNTQLQFQIREETLHLTVTVRSNDVMWGWSGINAFEWSTLLEIVAALTDTQVGTLVFNIANLHLYKAHWEKALRIVDSAGPFETNYLRAGFNAMDDVRDIDDLDEALARWFEWEALCREGRATLEGLAMVRDPMFRAWAAAIAYYWQRGEVWLATLSGTALAVAVRRTPASVLPEPVQSPPTARAGTGVHPWLSGGARAFLEYAKKLHAEKDASYGDSWKKRGEKLSILANIARKVDRLGVGDEHDSRADTVVDLWIYLAKYACWLHGVPADPDNVNNYLTHTVNDTALDMPIPNWEVEIPRILDDYIDHIDGLTVFTKQDIIVKTLRKVTPIALFVWLTEDNYQGADAQ